jgi:hypothetical protein
VSVVLGSSDTSVQPTQGSTEGRVVNRDGVSDDEGAKIVLSWHWVCSAPNDVVLRLLERGAEIQFPAPMLDVRRGLRHGEGLT